MRGEDRHILPQSAVRTDRHRQPGRRQRPRRQERRIGILLISICLLVFASFLVYQLYQIQIVNYAVNAEKAASQHYKRVTEEPRRGSIFDRNGVELAGTTYVHQIGMTPKDVYSITRNITSDEIAAGLAEALNLPVRDLADAMSRKDATYILIKKDVPRDEAEELKAFMAKYQIGGIRIDTEARRYYTNGMLASQVIGFCRFDEGRLIGQLGVELQYNSLLTGQPGYTYVETDNYGSKGTLPFSVPTSLRARDGENLVLNLDINIQKIAQEELEKAIGLYDITEGGTVIVMDPYSGAVLAMASWPFFSSSDPAGCPPGQDADTWQSTDPDVMAYLSASVWRNGAISDTYEPGSTMKAITAAIALEEGLTTEKHDVVCKPLQLFNWSITCVNRSGHGEETLEQAFWRSCNPVFAKLALDIGLVRFYSYMRAFGFMDPTGIDLPAEGSGILHTSPTDLDMATLSYGESSTVTPLQMAASFCTFANGGKLIRPSMVKSVTGQDGRLVREMQPETVRQVISGQTASRVLDLMEGVVLYGTGSTAYVEGYAIAGKTSTSTDDFGDHTLSFAGLAPAGNPELVALVVLNKPSDKELTSKAASRTCGQILARSLEYLGMDRVLSDSDVSRLTSTVPVPDVTGLTYAEALRQLASRGLNGIAGDPSTGDGTLVKYQWPASDELLHPRGSVVLYPVTDPVDIWTAVPDFRGRTVSECFSLAAESGLNIRISGSCLGVAVTQDPLPTHDSRSPENRPDEPAATPAATTGPDDDDLPDGEPPDQEPAGNTLYQRGDLVTLTFAPVEEVLAQNSETD